MPGTKKRGSKMSSGNYKKSKKSSPTKGVSEGKVEKLFAKFAEENDPEAMGMDGIAKLCEQLGLDPFEDIGVLVLLWKLGSKEKPAQISKKEFVSGCLKLQVDSVAKLKGLIPSLDTGFLDQDEFKDFYKVGLDAVAKFFFLSVLNV